MTAKIQIKELNNSGDTRGFSFTAPAEGLAFVGRMADVHLASIKTGAVRRNHYDLRRREAIVLLPGTKWSLHWDGLLDNGSKAPAGKYNIQVQSGSSKMSKTVSIE